MSRDQRGPQLVVVGSVRRGDRRGGVVLEVPLQLALAGRRVNAAIRLSIAGSGGLRDLTFAPLGSSAPQALLSRKQLGDVGYVDGDGFLYLTDRKAYTIISGGVNVYP